MLKPSAAVYNLEELTLQGMTRIHLPIDFFLPQARHDRPGTLLSLPDSVIDLES